MSKPELLDTIPYKPDYFADVEDEFIPTSLKTLQVRVYREEDERFVRLDIDCGGTTIMFMMQVCAHHAHCIIDGFLVGFERGYAQAMNDADEEFANSSKNNANQ